MRALVRGADGRGTGRASGARIPGRRAPALRDVPCGFFLRSFCSVASLADCTDPTCAMCDARRRIAEQALDDVEHHQAADHQGHPRHPLVAVVEA